MFGLGLNSFRSNDVSLVQWAENMKDQLLKKIVDLLTN